MFGLTRSLKPKYYNIIKQRKTPRPSIFKKLMEKTLVFFLEKQKMLDFTPLEINGGFT